MINLFDDNWVEPCKTLSQGGRTGATAMMNPTERQSGRRGENQLERFMTSSNANAL